MPSKPQPSFLHTMFIEHPQSVNETYFQHMKTALWYAGRLLVASLAAFVHAVLPCAFKCTASNMLKDMCAHMDNRFDCPDEKK